MKYIPHEMIDDFWPEIGPMIVKALNSTKRHKHYSSNHIFEMLATDEMKCFIVGEFDALCLVDIMQYPTGTRYLNIWLLVGNFMDEWIEDLVNDLITFSKLNNFNGLYCEGREGWYRIFKKITDFKVSKESVIHVEF